MQYAELHCRSNFSFLEAASKPEELVQRAAELGYEAIAITDRESLAGVVRAHTVAKELGVKLIVGAEVFPIDAPPAVLWPTDRASYGRLCRLLTLGRRRAEKGKCELRFADIAEHAEGLLAGVWGKAEVAATPSGSPGCLQPGQAQPAGGTGKAESGKPKVEAGSADRSSHLNTYDTLDKKRSKDGGARVPLVDCVDPGCEQPGPPDDAGTEKAESGTRKAEVAATEGMGGSQPGPPDDASITSDHGSVATSLQSLPAAFGFPLSAFRAFADVFQDRGYLLAELHYSNDDEALLAELQNLSQQSGLTLVAAGNVRYHVRARQPLYEVLTAVRLGTTVDKLHEVEEESRVRLDAPSPPASEKPISHPFDEVGKLGEASEATEGASRRTLQTSQQNAPQQNAPQQDMPQQDMPQQAHAGRTGMSVVRQPKTENRLPNAEHHLRSLEDLSLVYARAPELLTRTMELAGRCQFSLDELRYEYPRELAPGGEDPFGYLSRMTWKGAEKRYPDGIPEKVRQTIAHELELIQDLKYEAYFLTVFDLVRFARRRNILCQGRGSAANSAVCYCLGISSVDPSKIELLFERFVSKERDEAPDIDIDFEHQRREEVLQYLYEKYGRESAGMTATVITYRIRSAVRDVGKALGLSLDRVDALAKNVGKYSYEPEMPQRLREVGLDPESEVGKRLIRLVDELLGFPRHLSQHVGGMVMTRGPLCELVPIENASMPDRTVVQWDKDDLDALGILKVDCLCLGMLSAIHRAFDLIEKHYGRRLNLATVPQDDAKVYDMVCDADTIGVFQIESRAQMSMLPRLKPRSYYDLVIEIAIVRPGPIQGQMVHPYLRRRSGLEEPVYPNEEIKQVLHKTLGVPIFQEQAMRLAVVAAGFTPGEADQLRRAMAAWRRPGIIDQFERKLIDGMRARGLSDEFAAQVFNQIRGFGEYGFPESHSASFALLVYVSAWIKCHYPATFAAALLNSQPMGFYAPAQLVRDARQHGVAVRPIDVNHSDWDCTLEEEGEEKAESGKRKAEVGGELVRRTSPSVESRPGVEESRSGGDDPSSLASSKQCSSTDEDVRRTDRRTNRSTDRRTNRQEACGKGIHKRLVLRLGLRLLQGFPEATAQRLVEERNKNGHFTSQNDLSRRVALSKAWMVRLAEADALASLERSRRQALWEALSQDDSQDALPLLAGLAAEDEPAIPLPISTTQEEVFADYRTAGLSLKGHPLAFLREQLAAAGVSPIARLDQLENERQVQVAGIVLLRQRPSTAKGITFVTLEDETGAANLVLHAKTWDRFYTIARTSPAWIAAGEIQKEGRVIHVVVSQLFDLSKRLGRMRSVSRDFR